ncbi:phage tail tape measure protein [Clostridium botulinum]|uniref:phage tail tape measure protein n=1 Tax=Clostridium botulinum TaxID=1491 RepID=UPI0013F002D5|nr:phage tail tape measure protein [Clostridium botulinum]MCS6110708.1 phage tail tape measure protein [Clostridium botulinum]NFE11238.1 phage tail tape measure protein [Clostridium botulinum]
MGTGATLKVGASNSEFNKAMKDMATQMKSVKSEFTLASTQAKLFGNVTDQLKAKQTELTNKVKIQNDMLKNQDNQTKTLTQNIEKQKVKQTELASKIEETNKKYKESVQATGKNSEETKKLKVELDGLKTKYAQNDKAIDSNNRKLDNAVIKMNGTKASLMENEKELDNINKKLGNVKIDEFSNKMNNVSEKTGQMANKMKPASTAILGLGVASSTASTVFEDSMAKVFTIADETEVSYDNMKKAIMDLSSQTGISANDIADNVYNAISAGQKTGEAVNFVSNATKLAKAGFAESSDTLNILTTALNAYKLESSEATDISNKLIVAQNEGKTTVAELSSSMGAVIPIAKGANINMSELATSYAVMTKNGIATAESGTMLKAMFGELTKSGSLTDKALRELSGKGFSDLKAEGKGTTEILGMIDQYAQANGKSIKDMFGSVEAGTASITLLSQDGKEFNDILGKMNDSAGATDKAFERMSNTTGNTFKKSMNDMKISAIQMGDVLAPITTSIANGLKNITSWLSSLSEGQLKVIASIGGIIIGSTALLMVISKVSAGLSILAKGFTFLKGLNITTKLTSTTGLISKLKTIVMGLFTVLKAHPVIALITVVISAVVLLYNKCEWFRNGVNNALEYLKNLILNIPNALSGVVEWFKSLPEKAVQLLDNIKQFFINGWNSIVEFFTTSIPNFFSNLAQWFAELPNRLAELLGNIIGNIMRWGVDTYNYLSTNIPKWINDIGTWFSELPNKIWIWLVGAFNKIGEWGTNVLNYLTTNVPIWINNVGQWFSELPSKIWIWLVDCVTKVTTWGSNMLNEAKAGMTNVCNGIVDTFKNLPSKMMEIGKNIVLGIKNGIKNAWDSMTGWIGGLCDSFTKGVKDKFEIHSPSHIFRDEIGKMLAMGIGVGFETEMPNVNANVSRTLQGTVDVANTEALKNIDKSYNTNKEEKQAIYVIVNADLNMDSKELANVLTTKVTKNITKNKKNKDMSRGGNVIYV